MTEIWGFLGVAVAALIGGTGITGLLSGAVDLSKRSRLRRRIEKAATLRELLAESSNERAAIDYAIALDTARLAALSAVGLRARVADRLPFVIGAGVFYLLALATLVLTWSDGFTGGALGLLGTKTFEGTEWNFAAVGTGAGAIGSAIVAVLLLPGTIGQRRRAWVDAVLSGQDPGDAATSIQSAK